MKYYPIFFLLTLLLISGCSEKKKKAPEEENMKARIEQQKEKTEVRTASVRRDRFEMELVGNGKVEAVQKAVINFEINDVIENVFVKNGDRIRTGEPIVSVDAYKSTRQLEEARLSFKKAELELRSRLMSEGISDLCDTGTIPQQRLHTIMLQCGYTSACNAFEKASHEHEHIIIKAPFDGVIADLDAKAWNPSSAYKNLCTLIDNSKMEVVFNVLETEIPNLYTNMDVEITPYAKPTETLHGQVTEVNPRIDENGMVRIKAVTSNSKGILVDGMNVSILIKRQIENMLIVPKSSVLARQGKKVVFIHENGKAIWKYVTTGQENSNEVSITSGLKENEEVIYDNNLGLSHESEVTVIK